MSRRLAEMLWAIDKTDQVRDYPARNAAIYMAVGAAVEAGYKVGFAIDPTPIDPDFPMVAYIELPEHGQVSWHLPAFGLGGWDGHTTEEKYERCRAYYGPHL